MSDFSSILSSINGKPQVSQQQSIAPRPKTTGQQTARSTSLANGGKLAANNTAAGVKRRSEEPQSDPRAKAARVDRNDVSASRAAAVPQSRFQLSSKPSVQQKRPAMPHRPATSPATVPNPQKTALKPADKVMNGADASTSKPAATSKRGFASIMEKAKAAQEAAKATGPSGIKHKAVEKLSKRERQKLAEEAEAQRQAEKKSKKADTERSRNGDKPAGLQKGPEASYKGTMRKAAEPLSYRGTMRAAAAGEVRERKKQKGQAQDKYGGYASWSDLDDAEDEEEEDYDSEGSSDMEGGFDDVEREEVSATRAARKEDQEALEEEERHKREKMERKRKLLELSKSAATRKKY